MAKTRVEGGCKILKSNAEQLKKRVRNNVLQMLKGAAFDMRKIAADNINRGFSQSRTGNERGREKGHWTHGDGLQSDTGALAASLYVFAHDFNGYDKARLDANAKYRGRYSDFARLIENRVEAPKLTADMGATSGQAGIASAVKYAAWWEKGHNNRWTRRKEQEVFMSPARAEAIERLEVLLALYNLFDTRAGMKQQKQDFKDSGTQGKGQRAA